MMEQILGQVHLLELVAQVLLVLLVPQVPQVLLEILVAEAEAVLS
jgi:hypothetical protein